MDRAIAFVSSRQSLFTIPNIGNITQKADEYLVRGGEAADGGGLTKDATHVGSLSVSATHRGLRIPTRPPQVYADRAAGVGAFADNAQHG